MNVDPPEGVNPSGIGCTVMLDQQGVTLMRQVEGGSGTTSQNGSALHFGLPSDQPFTLKLYIPGDTTSQLEIYRLPGSIIHTGG